MTGRPSLTVSAKAVGIVAVSQVRITRADQFGLWPRAQRRWTLYCACRSTVGSLSRTRIRNQIDRAFARNRMKNWKIAADNLSKAGWSWDCVSALHSEGRTIWIADAHRGDGKRFSCERMKS